MAKAKPHPKNRQVLLRKLLQELRDKAKLSQRELGELMGTSQTWIYNHEAGLYRLSFLDFIRWAEACGASPEVECQRFMASLKD